MSDNHFYWWRLTGVQLYHRRYWIVFLWHRILLGGSIDQNWHVAGAMLLWDWEERLQSPSCDRTFKDGWLLLVIGELQDVLPHPLGLPNLFVLLLQNEASFSIGEKREYPPYNFTLPIRASTRHDVFMATNKVCKYTMSRKSLLADVFSPSLHTSFVRRNTL